MSAAPTPVPAAVPLRSVRELAWAPLRRGEPVTLGVPLPRGLATHPGDLGLVAGAVAIPIQVRTLDRWSDGSIRWALVSFAADAGPARAEYALTVGAPPRDAAADGIQVEAQHDVTRLTTGPTTFEFVPGSPGPVTSVRDASGRVIARTTFRIAADGEPVGARIGAVTLVDRGPVRAEVLVEAVFPADRGGPLTVIARVELFAGLPHARVDLTIRNPRRAQHPRGEWSLGDAGSMALRSALLTVEPHETIRRVSCAPAVGALVERVQLPFALHQESSGGERWNGPIHRNRDGRVPLRYPGYRMTSGGEERAGRRASPIVIIETAHDHLALAVPDFWENFPRAVRVADAAIEVGLFPDRADEPHELQGGEQKTHRVVLAFGQDPVSDPPLAWIHDPTLLAPSPAWCCATGAVPYVAPAASRAGAIYETLAAEALDPQRGLRAKREPADEYGWRNFGDLPADHESAFQPPDRPFVSHYNNQYDAVAAFAVHYLRTADPRWWRLMSDLARHVRDIDIYHTSEDKSAYNGGLFWHTAHYVDAGLSTHRTYPPGSGVSGGPSAEHNYNAGLMLHYFLTGESASRDAAIGLGDWVIRMDDGRRTPWRWLARGPTGLASLTRDTYGPGRGAGHSILACLTAARLTGDAIYRAKAEELILRTIHPRDDVGARQLLDAERRWSYTAFLQALGVYLDDKAERGELDRAYAFARESLLHYARWMADHERPYLDRAETLEYPTETWVAQDLRKADVWLWAAGHASPADRTRFLERAGWFFEYATRTLAGLPERTYTRPLVLVLGQGVRYASIEGRPDAVEAMPAPSGPIDFPAPAVFVPQRTRALRRAAGLAVAGAITAALLLAFLLG